MKPEKLTRDDYYDVSGLTSISLKDSKLQSSWIIDYSTSNKGRTHVNFPEHAKGFFYYAEPKEGPLYEGEVRFRCCESSDPSAFASGSDLLLPSGTPWNIPLVRIAEEHERYQLLPEFLIKDGAITYHTIRSCPRRRRILRTLNSSQLDPTNYYDLQGLKRVKVQGEGTSSWLFNYVAARHGKVIPFPQETKGYFYYFQPPNLPEIAGEVRFRCMDSSDPAGFEDGHDLRLPDRTIWRTALWRIQATAGYKGLADFLRKDGIVKQETLDICAGLGLPVQTKDVIFSLNEELYMDFSRASRRYWIVGHGHAKPVLIRFCNSPQDKLFTGSAMVRFERSPLLEHRNAPHVLVIRIVEILQPIECISVGYSPVPVEGELLVQQTLENRDQQLPLLLDTELAEYQGLRLLMAGDK
ncbi:hypothetical protein BDQ12DRAFT_723009 [Crucibulum laeve]|uniref:Uncharacterized protein n=1 Tax=Crucibulum laeve TaxID=68775 RepID=A0A5C3MBZ6_9AGAR|nr:hypothetical protein BDQ12DRAFT_723009 [Crucibulum laeve]